MTRNPSDGSGSGDHHRIEATRRKILGWNNWVDMVVGGLKPIPALVWAVLYRHAREGVVTRANSTLARDLGVSKETIKRAIQTLRNERLLRVVRQGGMHVGATTYQLLVRPLKKSAEAPSAKQPTVQDPAPSSEIGGGTDEREEVSREGAVKSSPARPKAAMDPTSTAPTPEVIGGHG
jgi:DNA-binding transcriptional MocR family regulator